MGPVFKDPSAYSEINLKEAYRSSALRESNEISEKAILAVINKWNSELYPYFGNFMLAAALDPLTFQIAGEIKKAHPSSDDEVANSISLWAKNRLVHTQTLAVFKNLPGKDPWGAVTLFNPAFKKDLPSEMLALSAYAGKINGKCCSLAALNAGLFAVAGANPEDILVLRYGSHNTGIVKYNGVLYLLNNEWVVPMDPKTKTYLMQEKYQGFFCYSLSVLKSFTIGEEFFTSKESLLQTITKLTGTTQFLPKQKLIKEKELQNREALFDLIFRVTDDPEHLRQFTLTRYAYQSLYVKNPGLYLKASVRGPLAKTLSKQLHSEEEIISWIRNNIASGPVFEDYEERLMLADQVIVFQKGGPKDQAVLAWSLLKLHGFKPVIKVTREAVYLEVNGKIYEAKTWNVVNTIRGKVELTLSDI